MLAVLLVTNIGVLRSPITAVRGYRISAVVTRTSPLRAAWPMDGLFGLFNHLSIHLFNNLPHDQGGSGRHKCVGCAYDLGYDDGLRRERLHIDLDNL